MHETIYRRHILDHYQHPRNFGTIKKPTHEAGHANVSCGDQMQFQARITKGTIEDIAFTGSGCALSMAGSSVLTEFVKGKKYTAVEKLSKKNIQRLLKIPISPARERCALLGLETIQKLSPISRRRKK